MLKYWIQRKFDFVDIVVVWLSFLPLLLICCCCFSYVLCLCFMYLLIAFLFSCICLCKFSEIFTYITNKSAIVYYSITDYKFYWWCLSLSTRCLCTHVRILRVTKVSWDYEDGLKADYSYQNNAYFIPFQWIIVQNSDYILQKRIHAVDAVIGQKHFGKKIHCKLDLVFHYLPKKNRFGY